jgi:hypothetical protein
MRKCGVCDNPSSTNYYEVFTQSANVKSSNRVFGGQNIIYVRFSALPSGEIIVGDKITINSGTMAGEYPISNILNYNYDGTYWYYTLEIPTSTIPTQSAYYSTTVTVNRLQTLQVIAPPRNYSYSTAYQNTRWFLNNSNAINEIPTWAYYYSIVRTLNLKTRFFIQSFSNALQYVTRDSAGAFVYNNNYSSTGVGIGIHTAALLNSGLGYTYTEKDMCVLWNSSGSVWELPVIGQDGNYIHLKNTNIGQLNTSTNKNFIYEIYTPYQEQINEPYYEIGEIYNIFDPGTSIRNYSVTTGSIVGDTYAFTRAFQSNNFIVGAMSPNDLFWKKWETDSGKVNIVTKLSQTVKNTNIAWSDTFISGTQINGTSTFRFGNETYVSDDCGSINKLQLTSKVQDQGTVMLSLCTAETNSMYLGETQITDSTGKVQFFTSSKDVISTINTLKGNYGCINPESVTQYRGKVYFVDTDNGRVVQYSENGLDNISSIKMSRFWKNYLKKYNETSASDIESYGSRPFIFSVVDPYHDELLISIPKLSINPAHGFLPDYTTTVYPFDIMDYMNKTMVYKLGTGAVVVPHWQGSYTFSPEYFSVLQNRLFSFKNGNIYEHNQPLQNNFYGAAYYSSIMFTSNILPQIPKIYDNFVSESNIVPSFVYFYNNYPYLQTSDLDDTSFKSVEGIWYANILRNKSNGNNTFDGLLKNEVMKGNNMYVWLKFFVPSTVPLQLNLLQLGMSISKGHTV